jgi:hypothetical protein
VGKLNEVYEMALRKAPSVRSPEAWTGGHDETVENVMPCAYILEDGKIVKPQHLL